MSRIHLGPTGNIIKGSVLDCAQKPLEEALRFIDPLLYVKWNPRKLKNWGCWEVRRKSELKTIRASQPAKQDAKGFYKKPAVQGDIYEFDGFSIIWPKYHELDIVNHVLDIAFLNYNVLTKLKDMDMWSKAEMGYKAENFVKVAEYNEAKHAEKLEDKMQDDLQYGLKQLKPEIKAFKEYVHRNGNPYRLAEFWDQS